ncbi:MAG: 50S ribosomal protein L3 [Bacteriovoracaceae bacterium]
MSEQTQNENAEAQAEASTPENTKKTEGTASLDLTSFVGQKAGMTRIFDDNGTEIPVTVVKLIPNFVSQVKTQDKDGYSAYQVGYHTKKERSLDKPTKTKLSKAGIKEAVTKFKEFKVEEADAAQLGARLGYGTFATDTFVDVTGTSKGKGFQGVIKRYGFRGGPGAHGSKFHRTTGSIGNRATPGKVWKNKKMPGHMGDKTKTIQNLKVVEVNTDNGYMLIKGSIPGSKEGFVTISKALKKA